MSVLHSKHLAINVVEIGSEKSPIVTNDGDGRIANLENQVEALKRWKTSLSSPQATSHSSASEASVDPTEEVPAAGSPPNSSSSLVDKARSAKAPDTDLTSRITTMIQEYGQNEENEEGNAWLGRVIFESHVRKYVDGGLPIELVLPAFPWKSVNKVEKVLGAISDLGEELALGRLNALCEDILEIYEPGAKMLITSDGLVYNDLLGIPDTETYEYGVSLRRMAAEKGYENIKFTRIMNLLGLTDSAALTREEYLATVKETREMMVTRYLDPEFDCDNAIAHDRDINLTYCGYMQFLAKDLRHSPITEGVKGKNEYKRVVKQVARDMIARGKAFANLIDAILPTHIRLSIHRSTGLHKHSFPLVPQPSHFSMTPWHCCIAVTSHGDFRTAHAAVLRDKYDLVERNGQPWCFRDRSEVWRWEGVEFEFFYPRGVVVRAAKEGMTLGKEEIRRIRTLGKGFQTVIVKGFV